VVEDGSATGLPSAPPCTLTARMLSHLAGGGVLDEPDGLMMVDAEGRIAWVGAATARPEQAELGPIVDIRPLVLLPGLIDLHGPLPQMPHIGRIKDIFPSASPIGTLGPTGMP
jgi:cytosine/adenosine deaminase-related metal-dependent hydrolase